MNRKKLFLLVGAPLVCALLFLGCADFMYPTVADVRLLAEAERNFQEDLQVATVETMTSHHSRMSPENQEWFDTVLAQNRELASELAAVGKEKADTISGPALAELNAKGADWLDVAGLGWLIPFWSMFFGKSRGTKELADLKSESATELAGLKDKVENLTLSLAVAAKADSAIPSDSK